MINILLYILQFFLFIILLVTLVLFSLWSVGNLKNRVPFVTSSKAILPYIAKALDISSSSIVYDLGCGDGRVLFYLARLNEKAKFVGIENNLFPFVFAKLGVYSLKKKHNAKIEIINKDFFKKDLSEATHIFTYLYPDIMDDLLFKFNQELKTGTKLVSLSFQFTNKSPLYVVDLGRSRYKLGHKLYVYEF